MVNIYPTTVMKYVHVRFTQKVARKLRRGEIISIETWDLLNRNPDDKVYFHQLPGDVMGEVCKYLGIDNKWLNSKTHKQDYLKDAVILTPREEKK